MPILRDDNDRQDIRYAPLICEDLSRLPPALVIVAGYDPLRDEGIAYAERLKQAGNRVELTNYEGMVHPFLSMSGALDVGKQAIAQASAALKEAFAAK
jgi:acetyl esterase